MADQKTAEAKLAKLRDLVANARSMPMSASCVVNRNEVLAAIDDVIDNLPDEIAEAQDVIENSSDARAAGEAEAARITERGEPARGRAGHRDRGDQGRRAEGGGDRGHAEADAAALRREADAFVDSRMASFESVLARTTQPGPDGPLPVGRAQQARPTRRRPDRVRRRRVRRRCRHHGRPRDLHPVSAHRRLDRRSGLVLDTHDLTRRAGRAADGADHRRGPERAGHRGHPRPRGLTGGAGPAPRGSGGGVLVTGTAVAQLEGECVRCLTDIS